MYIISTVINFASYIADNLGTLCNRATECCRRKSTSNAKKKTDEWTNDVIVDAHEITKRKMSLSETLVVKKTHYQTVAEENAAKGITTVEIPGSSPQEIVENYILGFLGKGNPLFKKLEKLAFFTGHIDPEGKVQNLNSKTYERIQKTGFYYVCESDGKNRITIPLLEMSRFEFFDNCNWFKSDLKIQKKIETITNAHRAMLSLLKITHERILKFGFKEKVSNKNLETVNMIQEQRGKRKMPIILSNNRHENAKLKLQLKQTSNANDKKSALEDLVHFERMLEGSTVYSSLYPSTANAYMLFEGLSNNLSDTTIAFVRLVNNIYFRTELLDHIQHLRALFEESMELLLPHALKIMKAFKINLMDDDNLKEIFNSSPKTSKSALADLLEHQKIQDELARLKEANKIAQRQKNKKQETKGATVTPLQKPTKKTNKGHRECTQQLSTTLEEIPVTVPPVEPEEHSIPEYPMPLPEKQEFNPCPQDNEKIDPKKTKKALEATRLIARQEKNKAKEKRIAERRTIRAEAIVSKHKEDQNKQKDIEQKERQSALGKIHELPSEELVWNVIFPSLSSHNATYTRMIFGQEENHLQISGNHVENLGKALRKALEDNDISCANDFFNYLMSRMHYRHDSDTGDLLPRHYLDILRSCLIIFGIFPKNWKPKTEEDFDAMEKYYQRRLDYFYWESRI